MYALITGASSGIGKAIAFELAKKKINLVLVARREKELNDVKSALMSQYDIDVVVKIVDVSNQEACVQLHQSVQSYDIEMVINNAGFGKVNYFTNIELAQELSMIDVNIVAVQILTKLFVQTMKKGVILNVASMAGMLPTPLMATYAATKSYVLYFSRSVNYELKKQQSPVRVLTLNPGPVDTEFAQVAETSQGLKGMSAERCARIAVRGMMRRKAVIVPGFSMKVMRFLVKVIPYSWILPIAYRLQKQK